MPTASVTRSACAGDSDWTGRTAATTVGLVAAIPYSHSQRGPRGDGSGWLLTARGGETYAPHDKGSRQPERSTVWRLADFRPASR